MLHTVHSANDVFFARALEIDAEGNSIPREGIEEKQVKFSQEVANFFLELIMPLIRWAI